MCPVYCCCCVCVRVASFAHDLRMPVCLLEITRKLASNMHLVKGNPLFTLVYRGRKYRVTLSHFQYAVESQYQQHEAEMCVVVC